MIKARAPLFFSISKLALYKSEIFSVIAKSYSILVQFIYFKDCTYSTVFFLTEILLITVLFQNFKGVEYLCFCQKRKFLSHVF